MDENEFTISGPKEEIQTNENLGEYFIDCLRKRERDEVVYIDALTEEVQTCGDLLDNAVKTVYVLKNLGLEKDEVMAIISENNIKYQIPILAAFFIGITVHLLNPAYSSGELQHALLISKPKVIFCSSTAYEKIEAFRKEFDFIKEILLIGHVGVCTHSTGETCLDALLCKVKAPENADFVPETYDATTHGALILQSSGTTGLPKGVLLTHRNFRHALNYLCDQRYMGLNKGDVIAQLAPKFHVIGILLSFSGFLGTKIVILHKLQWELYLRIIEQYKVNKLHMVPFMLHIFHNYTNLQNYDLSSIESIMVGASPIFNSEIMHISKKFPKVNFREVYGMTEVCCGSAFLAKFPKSPNCVGVLVPNITARIWDSVTESYLGCRKIGEICFKGPMVMSKYMGIPNNKNIIDEEGYYHSGDFGYYDENGLLYVVDRIKNLIKYRGFQVAPVEIEHLLLQHPAVEECGVIGIPDKMSGELPLAFVVCKTGCSVTKQEIIEFVDERISKHKRLYGGVRFIDAIPKNATGKINRKELKELFKVDDKL